MKIALYAALAVTGLIMLAVNNHVLAEEHAAKKVCVDVKDKDGKPQLNKDGTAKQQCKEVTVHKKLEGTEVPKK